MVDDESASLTVVTNLLTAEGYHVRPADSGRLALASVEAVRPDLILLDVRMPGMDGFEVCRQLQAREETREIPVMFLSASTDQEERVAGMALGAVDFVAKPFFRPELLARIRTHLELGRLRSNLEIQVARRTEELVLTVKRLHEEIAWRERAQQSLHESEERFRNMADTAPVMIVASDANQRATFFNKEWLTFTGCTFEQELGEGWISSLHPDDVESSLAGLAASYRERKECRLEYRLRRADGEYRSVLCKGIPRFEPDGIFAGYIASVIDITDLKRGQELAVARQKLKSLSVLASGVAHDFNNLLGGIMADAELLVEELEEHSSACQTARSIGAIAVRASEIVRQLMTYAGQETTALEAADLAALVREMLQLVHASISKRATLKVELPEKLPLIQANPSQLRQVVMNLITNASEALEGKEGTISVTAQTDVASGAPGPGQYLRLEVADTGRGMSQEIQSRIFDPYFTTKVTGRGLGLAAVEGIIRSHGGSITVSSVPGRGSRFTILLPCVEQPATPAHDSSTSTPVPETAPLTGTVLVIEDEDVLRVAVSRVLRKSGFVVLDAADGKTGVDLFHSNGANIDVVLLDLTLPGMSGLEVFTELRRINPQIRVIVTSAYSRDWALINLGEQNPWRYIRKPYHLRDMIDLIRAACSDRLVSRHPPTN